jgi:predicted amidophosphoribosyltransferase
MVRNLLQEIVGGVFPGVCPGCGAPADPVCRGCAAAMRPAPPARPPEGVDAWFAPFSYDGVARELIARAKYRGRHASLAWLAAAMVAVADESELRRAGVVTWVPTDSLRRRARGFDHAQRLAMLVGASIGRPVRSLLVRGPGPAQTKRAIAARREGPAVRAARTSTGTVLLVDDVSTTGASLRVCAAALRSAGAARVVAVTCARTPVGRVASTVD